MNYDQQGGNSSGQEGDSSRVKRPRSTMACIRCRKKKVKCDFVQPTCGRCAMAGLPCSYATPPRRVDGHAFDVLGNHVEELKERMQRMQSELQMMKSNLNPFAPDGSGMEGSPMITGDSYDLTRALPTPYADQQLSSANFAGGKMTQLLQSPQPNTPVTWKLSLSPSGLRIDTNIASVADLYRILLNGISQLNINQDALSNSFSTDSLREGARRKGINRKKALESSNGMADIQPTGSVTAAGGGQQRLWEISDAQAEHIRRETLKKNEEDDDVPKKSLDDLMETVYHNCFAAYCIVDRKSFMQKYYDDTNPHEQLLLNSIYAWMSKHGCIHHRTNTDRDPTTIGESYFKKARQLLKKCFDVSSTNTIHALLNLYQYQLASERPSQAYLYIGLAIRMAQDLKLHKKDTTDRDPYHKEMNKRLWWSSYWLDLCAALETNRPTMVDDKDCDLEYPSKMDHEDEETGYRVDFCVHSIKLMKIRKDITKHLPSEQSGQSLLSAISKLENSLTVWYNELPPIFHFEAEKGFDRLHPGGKQSFRDDACLILNIAYQTTWIMLHKFFLPKADQTPTPVALLSLNICTKSANTITKLLDIYSQQLDWCQFFYNLDGVFASVRVHQQNAQSTDADVQTIAQRNLLITAEVLKKSPLTYMDKVNDIIDNIEEFCNKHNIPLDLDSLPTSKDSAPVLSTILTFPPEASMGNSYNEITTPTTTTASMVPQRSNSTSSQATPSFTPSQPRVKSQPQSLSPALSHPATSPQQRIPLQSQQTQQPVRQPQTVLSQSAPGIQSGIRSNANIPLQNMNMAAVQQSINMNSYSPNPIEMLSPWSNSDDISNILSNIPYQEDVYGSVASQPDYTGGSFSQAMNFSSPDFTTTAPFMLGNTPVSGNTFTPSLTSGPFLYDTTSVGSTSGPGGFFNPQTTSSGSQMFTNQVFDSQSGFNHTPQNHQVLQNHQPSRAAFATQQQQAQNTLANQSGQADFSGFYDQTFPSDLTAAIMDINQTGINAGMGTGIPSYEFNFQAMDTSNTGNPNYGFYANAGAQGQMGIPSQQQPNATMPQWSTSTTSSKRRAPAEWDE